LSKTKNNFGSHVLFREEEGWSWFIAELGKIFFHPFIYFDCRIINEQWNEFLCINCKTSFLIFKPYVLWVIKISATHQQKFGFESLWHKTWQQKITGSIFRSFAVWDVTWILWPFRELSRDRRSLFFFSFSRQKHSANFPPRESSFVGEPFVETSLLVGMNFEFFWFSETCRSYILKTIERLTWLNLSDILDLIPITLFDFLIMIGCS
jgi:hypothetical protein